MFLQLKSTTTLLSNLSLSVQYHSVMAVVIADESFIDNLNAKSFFMLDWDGFVNAG